MRYTPVIIKNKTAYRTAALRKFFKAGLEDAGANDDRIIRVEYGRGKWAGRQIHGRAAIGGEYFQGRNITIWLPKNPEDWTVEQLGRVWDHEVAHTLGVKHKDMDADLRKCRQPAPEWCKNFEKDDFLKVVTQMAAGRCSIEPPPPPGPQTTSRLGT